MGKYTYLLLDVMAIIIPLIASFDHRLNFYKRWRYAVPAILLVAFVFIVWDEYFTRLGIWGFNPKYLTGFYLLNLPLEEILFFICIPYACMFTYDAYGIIIKPSTNNKWSKILVWVLIMFLLTMGLIHFTKAYTSVTFISLSILLFAVNSTFFKQHLPRFFITFGTILLPFFIINGILTGSFIDDQVVWYDDGENLGLRMFTIPFEDTFYGMLLLLSSIFLFENFKRRAN